MQSFECLSPDILLLSLQNRAEELLRAVERTKKSLKRAPQGHLRLAKRGNQFYGYHLTDAKSLKGEYIPKDNVSDFRQQLLAFIYGERELTQEEYDKFIGELNDNFQFDVYMEAAHDQLAAYGLVD